MYLVGTGPGDPGLLTLRAAQLMDTADVVLYDRCGGAVRGAASCRAFCQSAEGWRGCRLVSPDILQLIHGGAMMVYVGKQKGFHTRTQDEIHALLCRFAHAGATVLRLKGGDPYIFGRGGEEAQYLRDRGISVHCVPGAVTRVFVKAQRAALRCPHLPLMQMLYLRIQGCCRACVECTPLVCFSGTRCGDAPCASRQASLRRQASALSSAFRSRTAAWQPVCGS